MTYYFALAGAGIVGICVALEPTVNSALAKLITPRLAALHSFLLGTILVLIINALAGGFKEYRNILKAPPYLWIGGLLGATVVYLGARVAGVIGIASTVTVMVAVQLVTGIAIDSLGLLGTAKVPLDTSRVIGVIIMVIAVKLIVK
ncbi:MAG: DMT family transporter [Clostridia bacterium]|nr:DMT family transporter [Clostridia bacterium]